MTKQCTKCKEFKPLEEFKMRVRNRIPTGKRTSDCKKCARELSDKWARNNRDKIKLKYNPIKARAKHLESYGLTPEQYNKMLDSQNHACAICKKEETVRRYKAEKIRALAVDHSHKTGKVRDLLCDRCNRLFGLLDEDLSLIMAFAEYAKKHSS